jgi:hypothetical protein
MLLAAPCQIATDFPPPPSPHLSAAVDTLNRSEFRILSRAAIKQAKLRIAAINFLNPAP